MEQQEITVAKYERQLKRVGAVALGGWKGDIKKYKELFNWLDKNINQLNNKILVNEQDNRLKLLIFTETHSYSISARLPNNDDGYLGCIASTRKSRVGENWQRGNDLADGDYSEETFNKILLDIVSYEILELEI